MDTDTLVEEFIDDGQKLIEVLTENEIDVTAACWVKTSEEGAWFLYIATEEVDKNGLAAAYREVYQLLRTIASSQISASDIKLIGKSNPITENLLEIHDRYPNRIPTRSRSLRLASLGTEEIYPYPLRQQPLIPYRQSITVSYSRQPSTNTWRARTKLGELYRGMRAKGAVGYSTARWEGEKEGDEKHATVSVLLEATPDPQSQLDFVHPGVAKVWANQARELADEMFQARHPDAEIVHDNSNDD